MAKQTTIPQPPKRSAAAAFEALQAKLREFSELDDQLRVEQVAHERAGVVPETEDKQRQRRDLETRARARINGAAFEAAPEPAHSNTSIRLHEIIQNRAELNLANEMLRKQLSAAAGAAASEAGAEQASTFRSLHRHRALLVVQLLRANADIEKLRRDLTFGGIGPSGPMDGHTGRLMGDPTVPSPLHEGAKKYLAACIKEGVISEDEAK